MVRFSSFLGKGKKDDRKKEPHQPAGAPPAKPPSPEQPPPPAKSPPPVQPQAVHEVGGLEALHARLLAGVKPLFGQARAGQPLDLSEVVSLIEELSRTKAGLRELALSLFERHTPENYLYSHSVNVALLANHLGRRLGHADEALHQLTLAGLLCDIGMAGEGERIAAEGRGLTDQEWQTLKTHPAATIERLKQTKALSAEARAAIVAHHERPEGQGYPSGLPEDAINEYAKILAVCDVYDALIHPRRHRKRMSPSRAIRTLIEQVEEQFDRQVVKVLVDELSLYPPGSVVRLSTNEVGVVEQVRSEAPLRPVIRLSHDASGTPIPIPRRIDLIEHPFIHVKEVVEEEEGA